jgi:hypothetical protein
MNWRAEAADRPLRHDALMMGAATYRVNTAIDGSNRSGYSSSFVAALAARH